MDISKSYSFLKVVGNREWRPHQIWIQISIWERTIVHQTQYLTLGSVILHSLVIVLTLIKITNTRRLLCFWQFTDICTQNSKYLIFVYCRTNFEDSNCQISYPLSLAEVVYPRNPSRSEEDFLMKLYKMLILTHHFTGYELLIILVSSQKPFLFTVCLWSLSFTSSIQVFSDGHLIVETCLHPSNTVLYLRLTLLKIVHDFRSRLHRHRKEGLIGWDTVSNLFSLGLCNWM